MSSHTNKGFSVSDDTPGLTASKSDKKSCWLTHSEPVLTNPEELCETKDKVERQQWTNEMEFLFSCISMSVGLGNVWRFPMVALENGGGAFVLPYIVVLILVGKPIYYMEAIIGQFSSRGSVKVYDFCPLLRGIGFGQVIALTFAASYYGGVMALISSYLVDSFKNPLPWMFCRTEWTNCVNSIGNSNSSWNHSDRVRSSAELYFLKDVLVEKSSIDDGIGVPNWNLVLFLVICWTLVALIVIKGIHSSGKVSYFLAIFPYFIILVLLIRAITLPGAIDGIIFFLKPQWDQILKPKVWYAAVTQVFFSLSVCFGNIIMYASYNKFSHNIRRDALIVTSLDTFTSLLAGCTIFGILGNLAYQTGVTDVGQVVKSQTGLAFISYPDAIAKFEHFPQVFSVLFFFMLFVLGLGSNVAQMSCMMTVVRDQFPKVANWQAALVYAVGASLVGILYVTPGGQFLVTLVDFYGASFVSFVLAIAELIAIGWIYGVDHFCLDVKFMLNVKSSFYWRACWLVITPVLIIMIFIYSLVDFQVPTYKGYVFSDGMYAVGWCVAAFGIVQVPVWAVYALIKCKGSRTLFEKIKITLKPLNSWGPLDKRLDAEYKDFIAKEL